MKFAFSQIQAIHFRIIVIGILALLLAGCGGGGSDSNGNNSLPVSISLSANATALTTVSLSWSATYASDYRVYMNGSYLGTSYGTAVTASTLTPNTHYCFIVYAYVFPIGPTSQSNQACVTTPPPIHPSTPTNVSAVAISPGQINITWSASTGDFAGYKIYRDNVLLSSTSGTVYTDSTARSSTQYCYALSAYDLWGYESPKSAAVCATTPIDNAAPTVPSIVKVFYDSTTAANPTMQLTWSASTDNSGTVIGYKIYRDNLFVSQVTSPPYSDTGRNANTQYCYTITALDPTNNESAPSTLVCATTSWTLTTVDSNVDVEFTSIAVDASDNLHIAYYDGRYIASNTQVSSVNYATNLAGSWQSVTIGSSGTGVIGPLSLLVNTDGSLHVAYLMSSFQLEHASNTSGTWLTESIGIGPVTMSCVGISHDAANHLHLVYNPNGNVTYMTNASGTWSSQQLVNNAIVYIYGGTTCAITAEAAGAAHIAYYDVPNQVLKCATNVSGVWITEVVDGLANVGIETAIAADSNGKEHISYYDIANGDLRYATNSTGTWVAQTIDSIGDVGLSTSIDVDASGHVHISYTDATNHTLKYATNASGTWKTYTVDSYSYVGGYTSIAIDSAGKVHISYRGDTHVRYATNR